MANFDVTCPIKYPRKCWLTESEKEELTSSSGKYKVFFMYPAELKYTFDVTTIKSRIVSPNYQLLDWDEDKFLGVKYCKICRLALASDFGIALLTPRNFNVFLEIGYMLGISKPVLYIFNKNNEDSLKGETPPLKTTQLPFDLGQEIVLQYKDEEELKREIPEYLIQITGKVELFTPFQKALRENIKDKVKSMNDFPLPEILSILLIENRLISIVYIQTVFNKRFNYHHGTNDLKCYMNSIISKTGFIKKEQSLSNLFSSAFHKPPTVPEYEYTINQDFKPILQELFFTPGVLKSLIDRELGSQ